jgi:hypothetical protein
VRAAGTTVQRPFTNAGRENPNGGTKTGIDRAGLEVRAELTHEQQRCDDFPPQTGQNGTSLSLLFFSPFDE